jgi:3-oxoacyl-[acyl-carrier protein] reductase
MDLGLRDRSAVVLASTAGLGLASAQALLGEGARVAISGRDPERLRATVERLRRDHGDRVWGEAVDVTDVERLRAHVAGAAARFGAIDVLVTNSGGPPPAAATDLQPDALARAHDLLLLPAIEAIRLVLPAMRARKWGRIIGLTSFAVRAPAPALALSNTYRSALTAYLKTLSGEVARDGVLVNSICTGYFDTERLRELFDARAAASGRTPEAERALAESGVPIGRAGRLEEFGAVVAFLASERASYVTGVALPVDGGLTRSLL